MPLSRPTGVALRPAPKLVRALASAGVLLGLAALAIGILPAGAGASAGEYAILFLHVPAAWLSLLLYAAAAACAAVTVASRRPAAAMALRAIAPVGVVASMLALWTGLASQGTWWGWDARLVCELVLLLLFAGALALRSVAAEPGRAELAAAVLVLVGALNIPMVYLTVDWWNTLHERAAAGVGRSPYGVAAMAAMTLAFCMSAAAVVLARLKAGAPKEQE
ncbi:MAG TPA: cytochrome c biogenesis protein CcsA [Ramlibacter sp.]